MNQISKIKELQQVIEALQAKNEEQERALQYIIECPPSPLEFAKRCQFVNKLLDEKPSETLARVKVLSIYRAAPFVIGEMLDRHESMFKKRDFVSRTFIDEHLANMSKELELEDPMA